MKFHVAVFPISAEPHILIDCRLHHCNIDRWYARWQKEHPEAARTYAGNTIPRVETFDAKSSDRMSFYGLWNDLAVKDVFSTHGGMNGLLVSWDMVPSIINLMKPTINAFGSVLQVFQFDKTDRDYQS